MDYKLKIAIAITFIVCLLGGITYALTTWHGTITWTYATQSFTIWDSDMGGNQLSPPYIQPLGTVSGEQPPKIFYLQNDGTLPITVIVSNEVAVGCSASWSTSGTYSVSVGSTRVEATLTLTITGAGSYDFDFVLA